VLFGGCDDRNRPFNDVHILDVAYTPPLPDTVASPVHVLAPPDTFFDPSRVGMCIASSPSIDRLIDTRVHTRATSLERGKGAGGQEEENAARAHTYRHIGIHAHEDAREYLMAGNLVEGEHGGKDGARQGEGRGGRRRVVEGIQEDCDQNGGREHERERESTCEMSPPRHLRGHYGRSYETGSASPPKRHRKQHSISPHQYEQEEGRGVEAERERGRQTERDREKEKQGGVRRGERPSLDTYTHLAVGESSKSPPAQRRGRQGERERERERERSWGARVPPKSTSPQVYMMTYMCA